MTVASIESIDKSAHEFVFPPSESPTIEYQTQSLSFYDLVWVFAAKPCLVCIEMYIILESWEKSNARHSTIRNREQMTQICLSDKF